MMATAPAPKGPRLTLIVNSAQLSRLGPRKPPALHSPNNAHSPSAFRSPKSPHHVSPNSFGPRSPLSPLSPRAQKFDRSTEERPDRVFHVLNSKGQAQALEPPRRRAPTVGQRLMTDKIQKYLDSLAEAEAETLDDKPPPPQGNRNPHPQLVSPERNEHYLMKALKMNQGAQRDQYEENRLALEAKIRELEKTIAEKDDTIAEKDDRIAQLTAQVPKEPQTTAKPILSDADIAAWYEKRSASWSAWVDEFAHEETDRIAGLHPLQYQELRNGVRNFVRLTDDGKLPAQLFTPGKVSPFNTTRLLLYGLLNDFIVREILASPFWVFSAISRQAFDVDSPLMPAPSSDPYKTPAAIRLNTNTGWSSSGLPPLISPFNIPPAPTTARSLEMLSPRRGPALLAQHTGFSLATRGLSLQYNLPSKPDIEDLETLLVRTQQKEGEATAWRAQMMRILSDGGLSRDLCHASLANNEDKQMLANARREYARQLKDQFLSGPARFFLRDQDPHGIAILESRLVSELDFALRFSSQAWARPAPLHFIGLQQLNAAPLRGSGVGDDVVDFFPLSSQQARARGEKQQVVVVLRPAVGTVRKIGGPGKIWVKAQSIASPVSMASSLIDIDADEAYSETSIGSPAMSSLNTPSLGTSSQQTSTTPMSAGSNVMLPNRGLSLRRQQ